MCRMSACSYTERGRTNICVCVYEYHPMLFGCRLRCCYLTHAWLGSACAYVVAVVVVVVVVVVALTLRHRHKLLS